MSERTHDCVYETDGKPCPVCEKKHYDDFNAEISSLRSELERVRRELDHEKARHCIGGDIFEAERNRLILNQTMELKYLERAESAESELAKVQGYLSRLFTHLAPQCEQDGSALTLCTQIDNFIAGILSDLARLREALEKIWKTATDSTKVTEGMDIADIQFVTHEALKQSGATTSGEPTK